MIGTPSSSFPSRGPCIRAAMSKAVFAGVKQLPDEQRDAVLRKVDRSALAAIDSALPMDWYAMEHHMAPCVPLSRVAGSAEHTRIWNAVLEDSSRWCNCTFEAFGVDESRQLHNVGRLSPYRGDTIRAHESPCHHQEHEKHWKDSYASLKS